MSHTPNQRFEAVVRPHFDALYRAAIRLTRKRQDAEDLVQDVFLRAYARLTELEGAAEPRGWLLRVQYRLFIDTARHRRRSPIVFGPADADETQPASEGPALEDLADGQRLQPRLERAWSRLDQEQQALLALHAEGYTLAELEIICGASRNAVGARLHRARQRLAKLLERRADGHEPIPQPEI